VAQIHQATFAIGSAAYTADHWGGEIEPLSPRWRKANGGGPHHVTPSEAPWIQPGPHTSGRAFFWLDGSASSGATLALFHSGAELSCAHLLHDDLATSMHSKIVYLDAQDYSNIADAINGRGKEDLLPVYHALRKFAENGTFRFCSSYMVISEVLQLSPESLEIARRKAALVEELCGGNAFPSLFWMLGYDIAEAAERRGHATQFDRVSQEQVVFGGQWLRMELPPAEEMFAGLEQGVAIELEKLVRRKLGRPLNRKERRNTARISVDRGTAQRIVEESDIYPIIVGTELVAMFVSMLLGKSRTDVAYERFFRLIGSPTKLILAHEHMSSLRFMNSHLDTLKTTMIKGLTQLREVADRIRIPDDPESCKALQQMIRDCAAGLLLVAVRATKHHRAVRGISKAYTESSHYEEDVPSLRNAKLWEDLLTPYFTAVIDSSPMRRKLLDSDIVDFFHALYIPHCTVWRSDKYFANLAKPVAKRFGCTVVSRLADLPRALDDILTTEEQGAGTELR